MPYLVVESLKHGLDARKLNLASVVGTLEIAENGHITEGGEFQKRKAFVKAVNVFPANTFGLQPTDTGLETYGSIATPANLPSGVTYVRLQHPTVLDSGGYNATYHAMTQVTQSDNFNGRAFVMAKFSDGRTFLYYDGALVDQSRRGIVMEGVTDLTSLGSRLAAEVNSITDWQSTANMNNAGVVTAGNDLVYAPSGVNYDPTFTKNSVYGTLSNTQLGLNGVGTPLTRAKSYFTVSGSITAGATITITGPTTPTAGDSVTLATVTYTGGDTLTTFCARLVASMNSDYSQYGYSAEANAGGTGKIAIQAPVLWDGVAGNGITLTATYLVCTVAAGGTFTGTLIATLDKTYVEGHLNNPSHIPYPVGTRSKVKCVASGGVAPYTYVWSKVSGDAINIGSSTASATFFGAFLTPGQTLVAYFKCTVNDSGGNGPKDSALVQVKLLLAV